MKTESRHFPEICRLRGGVLVPSNVREVQKEDEEGTEETFYQYDIIKLKQKTLPSLQQAQEVVWRHMQQDQHAHILPEYDQGTQASVQASAQEAEVTIREVKEDQESDNPEYTASEAEEIIAQMKDIVAECKLIYGWIRDCLKYYYARKDEIFAASDQNELANVTWDFAENVPRPDGLKTLREIEGMFE